MGPRELMWPAPKAGERGRAQSAPETTSFSTPLPGLGSRQDTLASGQGHSEGPNLDVKFCRAAAYTHSLLGFHWYPDRR